MSPADLGAALDGPHAEEIAMSNYEPTDADHAAVDEILDEIRADIASGQLSAADLAELDEIEPGMADALSVPASSNGHSLANDYDALEFAGHSIDLAYARDQERAEQDVEPLARRTEDRLMRAYDRIAAGTYAPASFEFSSASSAGRALAAARWSRPQEDITAGVSGTPNCGVADAYGRCSEPFHAVGCGSIADPSVAQELQAAGAYRRISGRPALDADGQVWRSQWDTDLDLPSLLEGMTGVRMAGSPSGLFESGEGQRELLTARRVMRFGNPDDPDAIDGAMPAATRRTAAALAAQAGIASRAAEAREQYKAERERRIAALNPRYTDPPAGNIERPRGTHAPAGHAGQVRRRGWRGWPERRAASVRGGSAVTRPQDMSWDDLLGPGPADPEDVERALRQGIGEELPPRRTGRAPQVEGSDSAEIAALRRQLGI
jgi:hypothetical protein